MKCGKVAAAVASGVRNDFPFLAFLANHSEFNSFWRRSTM